MILNRRLFHAAAIMLGAGGLTPALAQETLRLPGILEISGAGAVSGTNFRDGILLALDHINASGGILGKQVSLDVIDTGSDAGKARAAVRCALRIRPRCRRSSAEKPPT
jgi:branched-chain amino acid transport system substrate-binding protein